MRYVLLMAYLIPGVAFVAGAVWAYALFRRWRHSEDPAHRYDRRGRRGLQKRQGDPTVYVRQMIWTLLSTPVSDDMPADLAFGLRLTRWLALYLAGFGLLNVMLILVV